MSFFSDLFEGNFGNLGTDIVDAPSSLANNPTQLAETLGGVGLLAGGLFGLGALGADAGVTAADAGAAAGAADAAAAGGTVAADAGAGTVAADAAAAAGAAGAGADALSLAPATAEALAVTPGGVDLFASPVDASGLLTQDIGAAAPDTATIGISDAGTATAPTFAQTDAELTGGVTGTAPAGTAAGGAGSAASPSLTSQLGSALSSPWTKLALATAPLGVALAMGNQSLPGQVGPAQANAAALASAGSALNPSQTASLTQMRQDAINAARQALFNQGVQNPEADTRWAQMTANIDNQVTAAAQTMIQQNIQNSLAGDQQLIQIAQLQMQSDQNFANNLLNATKALGTAAGLGGGTITLKAA